MEKLEIVSSETNSPTGICLPRAEAIRQQAWCRSTNIYVLNGKGEILCHQRSRNKERFPGVWFTHFGGHVGQDETYATNAVKELQEETGLPIQARRIIHWRTTRFEPQRLWVGEFVTLCDLEASAFKPQESEVDRIAWVSPQEILAQSKNAPDSWRAGVHDFQSEYQCLRAALNAAHATGAIETPTAMLSWMPLVP